MCNAIKSLPFVFYSNIEHYTNKQPARCGMVVWREWSSMLPRAHCQFCLSEAGQAGVFNVELITVEVGSRGLVDTTQFFELGAVLGVSHKGISQLFTNIIRTTLLESYKIWCYRNIHTYLLLSPMHAILFFIHLSPFCMYIFVTQLLLWCSVSHVLTLRTMSYLFVCYCIAYERGRGRGRGRRDAHSATHSLCAMLRHFRNVTKRWSIE